MYTLIVYDSIHGNTKQIADEIRKQFDPQTTASIHVSKMDQVDLAQVDLLLVGSPTHGGTATKSVLAWLKSIPTDGLLGKKVAAFDTRLPEKEQRFPLRLLMKIIDYAAPKIETLLVEKGGISITRPRGFFVITKEGPLKAHELEQAAAWVKSLCR